MMEIAFARYLMPTKLIVSAGVLGVTLSTIYDPVVVDRFHAAPNPPEEVGKVEKPDLPLASS